MPTAMLDTAAPPLVRPSATAGIQFRVSVYDGLAAAEPIWRRLESEAVLTPYQRYDWIEAWRAAGGSVGRPMIVVIEAGGDPVALLPLEVGHRLGMQRATLIGADIGNADWMILRPDAAALLTPTLLAQLLREAGRMAGGVDLIALYDQPASWGGVDNPLLGFPHQAGPDHFHLGLINAAGSFDRFDAKRLSNLERRKRKLGEEFGPVALRAAETAEEVETVLAAFLEQRAARFEQMGIANIFAEPHFRRFFRDAAVAGLGAARPTMIVHGLYAGPTIVATAIGTFGGTHYSQYINATASGEAAKFRLIGILMHELFKDCAARGATSIDMGLGDFDYKADWTVKQPAYDGIIPLTVLGRIGGAAMLAARRAKRAIKQHDRLWSLAKALRARLGKLRQQAG